MVKFHEEPLHAEIYSLQVKRKVGHHEPAPETCKKTSEDRHPKILTPGAEPRDKRRETNEDGQTSGEPDSIDWETLR